MDAQNSWLNTCNDYYNSLGLYGVPKAMILVPWDTTYYSRKTLAQRQTSSSAMGSGSMEQCWVLKNAGDTVLAVIIDLESPDLFFRQMQTQNR